MTTWLNLLGELDDTAQKLRSGLGFSTDILRSNLDLPAPQTNPELPYQRIKNPGGLFLEETVIDWRKLYSLSGSACFYKIPDPRLGLLFYDTILVGIHSCPKSSFDTFNLFRYADLGQMIQRAREGRVIFYLTDRANDYKHCSYLQPLLEEFRPLHLAAAMTRIVDMGKWSNHFDQLSESTTDIPHIRRELRRYAKRHHIALEVADGTTCYALQELYYCGLDRLAHALLDFLRSDPCTAIPLINQIRRLIVEPNSVGTGVSFAFDAAYHRPIVTRAELALRRNHISLFPDVGNVISKQLSFPTPTTWDQLKWCEDNLDLSRIRRAFEVLDLYDEHSDTFGSVSNIEGALSDAWVQRDRSVSRLKDQILWGTSLTLAVAGSFVSGPTIGILAALGMTVAQNLWLEPATVAVSKLLKPRSFHIWEAQRKFGRK